MNKTKPTKSKRLKKSLIALNLLITKIMNRKKMMKKLRGRLSQKLMLKELLRAKRHQKRRRRKTRKSEIIKFGSDKKCFY